MNIFVVDSDPQISAQMLCDSHVVKMVVESAQLLSTAYHLHGMHREGMYKPTHKHHPCTKWLLESPQNMYWLQKHAEELSMEYTVRYNKTHKTNRVIGICWNAMFDLPGIVNLKDQKLDDKKHTPFAQAMPDEYKHENAVIAYRQYYLGKKVSFAKWAHATKAPDWWTLNNPSLNIT